MPEVKRVTSRSAGVTSASTAASSSSLTGESAVRTYSVAHGRSGVDPRNITERRNGASGTKIGVVRRPASAGSASATKATMSLPNIVDGISNTSVSDIRNPLANSAGL